MGDLIVMELQYIYIKTYKSGVISKQDFNLSNQFRMHYDETKSTLEIKRGTGYIPDFFSVNEQGAASILTNITAIVGQNGTGKSTLLDYLKAFISRGRLNRGAVAVFYDYESKKHWVYSHQGEEILVYSGDKDIVFETKQVSNLVPLKPANDKKKAVKAPVVTMDLKDNQIVFFSNVFDTKDTEFERPGFFNISTNFLIKADHEKSAYVGHGTLPLHRYREVERQLAFINSDNKATKNLPFLLPKELKVSFSYIDAEDIEYANAEIIGILEQIDDDFRKVQTESESHERAKIAAWLINHLILEISNKGNKCCMEFEKIFKASYNKLKSWPFEDKIFRFIKNNQIKIQDALNEGNMGTNDNIVLPFLEFYQFIIEKLHNGIEFSNSEDELEFKVNNTVLFQKFDELYRATLFTHEYVTYDWRDLSSGEKALLNIYARFYSLVSKLSAQNILIMIDEGELYLHPQWQKSLIDLLIHFFSNLFSEKRVQIVLTSNSPFIVSDLPSSNVIFLKKMNNKTTVIDGLEENHQTFSSNIHNLLAYSFFLEDGFIGSFAKRKINAIIQMLISGSIEVIRGHRASIENTINMIGEPIIKAKLLHMLEDRLKLDLLSVESKIQDLQRQIDELRVKKKL